MNKLNFEEIIFQITRLTERAIALIDADHLDEALNIIDNRDRAVSILIANDKQIGANDRESIHRLDQLNEILLQKLVAVKNKSSVDIVENANKSKLHKAYQLDQIK